MTYVPGSARRNPTVTTNGSGQQVLTWTLDGVTTNADHALTYQAVADSSATPGQTLTNSAVASFGGTDALHRPPRRSPSARAATRRSRRPRTRRTSQRGRHGDGEGVVDGDAAVVRSAAAGIHGHHRHPPVGTGTTSGARNSTGELRLDRRGRGPERTVYYTTAPPATLRDDPGGRPTVLPIAPYTAGGRRAFTPDATAVRVIGGTLPPGAIAAVQGATSRPMARWRATSASTGPRRAPGTPRS